VGWEKEGVEAAAPDVYSSEEEVARAACQLATRLGVDFIGTFTSSGETARFAAKYRPLQPILAVTPVPETYRRLALIRGVVPIYFGHPAKGEPELPEVLAELRDLEGWKKKKMVLVSRDSVVYREPGRLSSR
jgi:pyruvate kinase